MVQGQLSAEQQKQQLCAWQLLQWLVGISLTRVSLSSWQVELMSQQLMMMSSFQELELDLELV